MDLLPEAVITSPEALQFVQRQRQDHEQDPAEKAAVAAAIPGGDPHIIVPWSNELALEAFRLFNANRRQAQRQAFPLGDNLLALIL